MTVSIHPFFALEQLSSSRKPARSHPFVDVFCCYLLSRFSLIAVLFRKPVAKAKKHSEPSYTNKNGHLNLLQGPTLNWLSALLTKWLLLHTTFFHILVTATRKPSLGCEERHRDSIV
jgi:hypothetical protein